MLGIERVKWSDDAIYIAYLGQVYTFPNHRLCSIFSLGNVPLIKDSYLVQDITEWQLALFLGIRPDTFVNGKMAKGTKQPMQWTYRKYFMTWVLLKRGYHCCSPSQVETTRMVLQKELHPLTVWKGELKALITNLMKP